MQLGSVDPDFAGIRRIDEVVLALEHRDDEVFGLFGHDDFPLGFALGEVAGVAPPATRAYGLYALKRGSR
jgi:hypothetical protein